MTTSGEELKNQGNALFAAGNYVDAVDVFTQAIALDSTNAVLHSNRSAALASLKRWDEAVEDARRTTELKPDWGKGWSRLGAALQGAGSLAEAHHAFQQGLAVDPSNVQLQRGCEATKPPSRAMSNPFASPEAFSRLRAHPKTAGYLDQADFVAKIVELQTNMQSLGKHLEDPRIMDAIAVIMNMNPERPSQFMSDDGACQDESCTQQHHSEPKQQNPEPKQQNPEPKKQNSEPTSGSKRESTAKTPSSPVDSSTPEEREALRLKELGNAAYKRRDFDAALEHYAAAREQTPNNPALLLNQSAVHYETERYEEAIAAATEAVTLARSLDTPSDYSFYGRAYSRIAAAHVRRNALEEAIRFYNKSLTEHRSPETLAKLRETEKMLADQARAALHNPELAEAARNEGNVHFREGRFAEAVTAYTEAIRRDEKDPRAYSNRAACYLKLAAIPEGLKDTELALQLDPSFTRAHIRRAALLFAKRDYSGCLESCDAASASDADKRHGAEIQTQRSRALLEVYRQQQSGGSDEAVADRVAKDPELAAILSDPAMRAILQQMQSDPAAAQDHMRNPAVAAKIKRLVAAGVLRTA